MDNTAELLVKHIARYLEQGLSEATIRKAMEPNELDDNLLDEAFVAIEAKRTEERKLAKEAEEAAKKIALEKHERVEDAPAKDKLGSSAGAEALLQDMAVSLHDAPKRKQEDATDLTASADLEIDPKVIEELVKSEVAASPQTSLTDELLGGIQPSWLESGLNQPQTPIVGSFGDTPSLFPGQNQPAVQPYQIGYSPMQPTPPQPLQLSPATFSSATRYTPTLAIADSFTAARGNLVTYIVAVVTAFVVSSAMLVLAALAIGKFFVIPFSTLLATPTRLLSTIIGSIVVYALWYVVAGTFALIITSLALFDGSQSRTSSIEAILGKSLAKFKKVATSMAVLGGIALLPMCIIALLPVLFVSFHGAKSLAYILPTLYFIAFAWAVFIGTRYALVPYVALFERSLSMHKIFARSKQLLEGSQIFLLLVSLPVVAFAAACAFLVHYRPQAISHPGNLVIDVLLLLVALLINGGMVMLYCNRKLFKS